MQQGYYAPSTTPPAPAPINTEEGYTIPREDVSFIGLRFDPKRQCGVFLHMPRTASDPLSAHSAIQAQTAPPKSYNTDQRWRAVVLSPGDLLEVTVAHGEAYSGTFVIDATGTITLPALPPIPAAGRELKEVQRIIEWELVENGLFRQHAVHVNITLRQLGEVSLTVGGSVFSPGLVSMATRTEATRDQVYDQATGSDNWRRKLSGVLKAAGGIRPDADLSRVIVRRGGRVMQLDLRGILSGAMVRDPLIADGDYVFVPSRSCFSPELIRTSRITPPGVRIYISNPTAPVYGNNPSAVGAFSTRLPYGSRLVQALVSGNCAGGAGLVAATRYALIVGENPLSKRPEVLRVNIQDVMTQPHRLDMNPYLQPGDAIACYDSKLINIRDIAEVASSVLSPTQILQKLLGF